ncbi:MAG: aquaporin [Verrucomicrobiota bacterium]
MNQTLVKQCVAEFIGTFALIFVGVGVIANHSGLNGNAGLLPVALAHGLTIAVMVSATGTISGGHLNPAVTFGPAIISGQWDHHYVYWVGPLIGGALAGLVYGRFLIKTDPQ